MYVQQLIIIQLHFKFHLIQSQWIQGSPFEEISIYNNSGHLEWRAGLLDIFFFIKNHPRPISAKFGLILYIPVILEEEIIMYV